MKTVVSPSVSRSADCPYHSSCMMLLWDEDVRGRAAAAHGRGGSRDEARHHREGECGVQAVAERRRDQRGEEAVARQGRLAVCRQRAENVGADEMLDRVVAKEGGEQD